MKDYRAAYNAFMKCYPFTINDLDGEEWKDIKGYEGYYQVSNYGRVKSLHNGKIKILKPVCDKEGYLLLGLKLNGFKRSKKVHRLVAGAFIENLKAKPHVNHIDGHKLNNCVQNLEWATPHENQLHASKTGLLSSGEKHYHAKFTNAQVEYIRANPDNLTLTALAQKFSVDKTTIGNIQRGKIYKNAGGFIRGSQRIFLLQKDRDEIRTTHKPYDVDFGTRALARKYSVSESTILRILHEQD